MVIYTYIVINNYYQYILLNIHIHIYIIKKTIRRSTELKDQLISNRFAKTWADISKWLILGPYTARTTSHKAWNPIKGTSMATGSIRYSQRRSQGRNIVGRCIIAITQVYKQWRNRNRLWYNQIMGPHRSFKGILFWLKRSVSWECIHHIPSRTFPY